MYTPVNDKYSYPKYFVKCLCNSGTFQQVQIGKTSFEDNTQITNNIYNKG